MTTLSRATLIVEHVHQAAARAGLAVSCSVVDEHGREILTARMDAAMWFTAALARVKAQTAATLKQDTSGLPELHAQFPDLLEQVGAQLTFTPTTLAGGIVHESGFAVGVSGAHPDQDVDLARQAMAHVMGR